MMRWPHRHLTKSVCVFLLFAFFPLFSEGAYINRDSAHIRRYSRIKVMTIRSLPLGVPLHFSFLPNALPPFCNSSFFPCFSEFFSAFFFRKKCKFQHLGGAFSLIKQNENVAVLPKREYQQRQTRVLVLKMTS